MDNLGLNLQTTDLYDGSKKEAYQQKAVKLKWQKWYIPQRCRPISEDLNTDELMRKLKTLAHTLQAMGQDDGLNVYSTISSPC
ncbi:hypothetical protein NQ317_011167 [Molorchus minor]|uniref:Uncharacterized protein n=1 Tax=Molorchus minor TaxID=1323400 RepID=A0ABQ9IW43_9CUCU|nr:hypothetical protein NQ317_011167 [Molorchus minor]